MEKIPEIFSTSKGSPGADGRTAEGDAIDGKISRGSGGGGPVEAVWWVKDVMVQWRIKGEAFVVGPDMEGEEEGSSGVRTVKNELGKRMRVLDEAKKSEWSWKTELTGHFGNCSPGMRGMFVRDPAFRKVVLIESRNVQEPTSWTSKGQAVR